MTTQTLVPCINNESGFDLTLRQFIEEHKEISYWSDYSVTSIIGKPNSIKYKILSFLFGITQDPEVKLDDSRMNIATAAHGKNLVQDINIQAVDFYHEKEYKTALFGFMTSDNILFILDKTDLTLLGIRKLLTIIVMSAWSTKDSGNPKKNLTLLVDCSNDIQSTFDLRTNFMQNVQQMWEEVIKPPGMEKTELKDLVKLDLKTFSAYDLEGHSSSSQLFDLRLSLQSGVRQEAVEHSSPLFSSVLDSEKVSPSKRIRSIPFPLELFKSLHEQIWYLIKNTLTIPDLYDVNYTERMNSLAEEQLEKIKGEVMTEALFEIMELREKIETEYIVSDFGNLGRKLYDHAIAKLRTQAYTLYLLHDSERLDKEVKEISQKIEFELYNLFETQVKQLKEGRLSELISRLNQTRRRMKSDEEYYLKLRHFVEQEEESLILELQGTFDDLQVFGTDISPRWEIKSHLEGVKEEFLKYTGDYIRKEIQKYLRDTMMLAREELRSSINLNLIENASGLWEEMQAVFVSIMDDKESILIRFLEANTKIERQTIEHQVQDFKRECFEYILGLMRENATELDVQLCRMLEKKLVETLKKKESSWGSQGQTKIFTEIEQTAKKLLQDAGGILSHLKYVKIDEDFYYSLSPEVDYPRPFLTDIKCNQIQNSLMERAKMIIDKQKKQLQKSLKVGYRRKIREEFIFWVIWVLLFYIYIQWPTNFILLIPILILLAIKGIQYSGITHEIAKSLPSGFSLDSIKNSIEKAKENIMKQVNQVNQASQGKQTGPVKPDPKIKKFKTQ